MVLAVWSMKGGRETFRRRLGIAIVVASVGSFVACLMMVRYYPLVSFFILPTRVWEFGLGALMVLAVGRADRIGPMAGSALSLAAIVGLIGSAVLVKSGAVQPLGLTTLVPTLSTALLIVTGASSRLTLAARLLSTAPMRLIGRLSYSWYLWHWPALVFLAELKPQPSLRLSVAVALLSLIPAAITYRFVESPIRFSKRLQRRSTLAVGGAVVLAATTIAMASVAIWHADDVLAQPRYAPIVAAATLPAVYDNGCHLSIAAVKAPTCAFGPARNDTTIVLFGDSHSAHWFPALESLVTVRGWKLVSLTKSACPSVAVRIMNGQLGRQYSECDAWREQVIARIVKLRPALVMIANTRAYALPIGGQELRTDRSDVARRAWGDGVRRLLAELAPSDARVMVMQNNPHPGFDVPRCFAKHIDDQSACATYAVRSVDTVLAASERTAIAGVPNASYVSLNARICDGLQCPIVRDGMVLYQDANHLSVPFSRALMPDLAQLIDGALAGRR
jgi:hypothetical protein